MPAWTAAWPRATASIVLPTPGGPISSRLPLSWTNRRVASSVTSLRSSNGWASKSKSAIRQGAGRHANRAREACRRGPAGRAPARAPGRAGLPAVPGGGDLDGQQPLQERGVADGLLGLGGAFELGRQRLSRGGKGQGGEMTAGRLGGRWRG